MKGHTYAVYGLSVQSDIPLALPAHGSTTLGAVTLTAGSPIEFEEARRAAGVHASYDQPVHALLADGASYVLVDPAGEFIVSRSGWDIRYRCFNHAPHDSFQVDLLDHALSFALLKRGFEPVRATAAVKDGRAIALIGEPGTGKSTLAAALLADGFRLLTDDVLMTSVMDGAVFAYPGPPLIRLRAEVAAMMPGVTTATGLPSAPLDRRVVPVTTHQFCRAVVPLTAIYQLTPGDGLHRSNEVTVSRLSSREATAALVRSAFNRYLSAPEWISRQVAALVELAECVGVMRLSYPRALDKLPDIARTLAADCLSSA